MLSVHRAALVTDTHAAENSLATRARLDYAFRNLFLCLGCPVQSRRFSSDTQLLKVEAGNVLLNRGSTGVGVGKIQVFLSLAGFRLPKSIKQGKPDGIFGPETEAAIKAFQRDSGLKMDGLVGPRTLAAMDQELIEKPHMDTASPDEYRRSVAATAGRTLSRRAIYYE